MSEPTRRRLIFEGMVQGVGFRAATTRLASGFRVRGFVRNLPDGTVELVAEGAADEVARLRAAIEAEFRANLGVVRDELAPTGLDLPDGFAVHR